VNRRSNGCPPSLQELIGFIDKVTSPTIPFTSDIGCEEAYFTLSTRIKDRMIHFEVAHTSDLVD
jgi:hypothetical protein